MQVGSLVKNVAFPNSCTGIVVKLYLNADDIRIYWPGKGCFAIWSRYSHNLELVCK